MLQQWLLQEGDAPITVSGNHVAPAGGHRYSPQGGDCCQPHHPAHLRGCEQLCRAEPRTSFQSCGERQRFPGLGCHGGNLLEPDRAADPASGQPALTFPGDWENVVTAGQRDAEVIVLGEAAAVQHVGPGEAESRHHWRAALLHLLTERVAGLDDLVQVVNADGSKEGAEEFPGVGVTLLLHQRDPGGGLLQHLLHRLVPQQVGQPHALVLDASAQEHRGGDGFAVGALVGEVGLPEGEEPGGRSQALGGQQEQGAEAARHGGAVG